MVLFLFNRVLGKFGGGNRKMMIEPQRLEYNDQNGSRPSVLIHFQDYSTPIEFPVEKVFLFIINVNVNKGYDDIILNV